MPSKDVLYDHHISVGLVPVADAYIGGKTTDYFSLENYRRITFIIFQGAIEDTGVSNVVTINASDDNAGSSTTAMAFVHRALPYSATVDTWGALTSAAAAGYNFNDAVSAANQVFTVEVTAEEVSAAQAGAQFVSMSIAETADKTVTAGILVLMSEPRYPGPVPKTAIL